MEQGWILLHPFEGWSKAAMFPNFDFGIARNPHISLHSPNSFGKNSTTNANVTLRKWIALPRLFEFYTVGHEHCNLYSHAQFCKLSM